MLNIIKSDIYRIFKGKAIYIAIAIMLALITLSITAMSPGHIGLATESTSSGYDIDDQELQEKLDNTKSLGETREIMLEYGGFALDKQTIGTNVNLYYLFIVIVIVVIVTDLSNSTAKNSLSSAISRKKYYFSKLATCLILCSGLVILNNSAIYILNYFINGAKFTSDIIDIIKITLYQLPLIYGIISLLISISFVSKKTAIFNSISIPLLVVIQLIIMGAASLFKLDASGIMQYEFQYALASLTASPTTTYVIECAGLGILYMIIFNLIGYISFKKTEIK